MKERLDTLIAKRNILNSREKAKAYILAGSVTVDGETVRTPGSLVDVGANIQLRLTKGGYVSRGGIKLERALRDFSIQVKGAHCLDIGASTGGFTDCLLKKGAASVTAVDVGKNQIAYTLRKDPHVRVVERFNARYIDRLELASPPDFVTADVSFISIRLILKPLASIITFKTDIVLLIKPQFEMEKPYKGFKGVVRDGEEHKEILESLHDFFTSEGYRVMKYTSSPLKGPKGNIEFFVHLKGKNGGDAPRSSIGEVVNNAHQLFREKRGE
jgi:23S rRNA (cytidine1920-2'-O)/16S rRNA (cytidine1409-2'-O)-methyltransferase